MQHNQYFTIAATFEDVIQRLLEYGQIAPPPKCKGIRFVVGDPQAVWDGVERSNCFAAAYCLSRWELEEPLFETSALETAASCRVRMRCLDPRIQEWFEAMLDWLAPDWTTLRAQPLPAVPSRDRDAAIQTSEARGEFTAGKSSRGRPSFPEAYKKQQVEEYYKKRGFQKQEDFCKGKPYTKRTLGNWTVWYKRTFGDPP